MSSRKKKSETKETLDAEGQDRISLLPDEVLSHILSLLPTKNAVATTTLSSRWNNLFASVPIIDLHDSLHNNEPTDADVSSFTLFVYKVLLAVIGKLGHIRKFHIKCNGKYDYSVVANWISAATVHNLEDLYVSTKLISPGLVPPALLACRTIVDLRLSGKFYLYAPNDLLFPCLKTIELTKIIMVDDDGVQRFFSGCSVLESLILFDCVFDTINVFELYVLSLKRLHIYTSYNDSFLLELRLNAPSLECFECNIYAAGGYSGDTLNSLKTADVSVTLKDEQLEGNKISQLINMVTHTRSLTLDNDSMEALVYSAHLLPTFHNLTELSVFPNNGDGWELLPVLLDNTPHLEVLLFPNGLLDDHGNFADVATFLQERVPTCISLYLKKVEYRYFNGEDNEIKIFEYLLKNAKMLEKMDITASLVCDLDFEYSTYSTMKKHAPLIKRLLSFPRSSKACRIFFNDDYN